MWARVFAPVETEVPVTEVQRWLRERQLPEFVEVSGNEWGWTVIRAGGLSLHRYHLEADSLRGELDTWAAVVELWDSGPAGRGLMQRLIAARQIVTLTGVLGELLASLAQFLAVQLSGFYQVDDQGFFEATGRLCVPEPVSAGPDD